MSQHIRRLEKLHGVKLLHRSTRRLAPTDAGQALAGHCRRLLATMQDTRLALSALKTDIAGSVRLAAPTGLDNAAFRRALLRIAREHPALQIELQLGEALADLREGGIDIALRGGEHALDAPDLIARKLAEWPWRICAAPGYLKTAPPLTHPARLDAHQWVYHQPPHFELARGRERHLLSIRSGLSCNHIAAVQGLCEAGLGLALIIEGEAAGAVQRGSLQIVLPEWQLPAIAIHAVTPHRIQSARIAAVLRILQESFAEPTAAAAAAAKAT